MIFRCSKSVQIAPVWILEMGFRRLKIKNKTSIFETACNHTYNARRTIAKPQDVNNDRSTTMGQYPARDSWGGSQYARVVRNETEYWVEWVTSPGQDPYEEFISALRHAATPAAAVAVARQVLADIRNDIA